ncbi:glutathione S-transferase domain-containing protein [Anaeromyces robustus]|jgi:elongation factor 1-gamma|uniref:Glutathione S-transferase domain-containing protein n=1 Tax=Anaeromyces robustus TaxID=1754192 RepID=A0A1Y1WE16_9FUNG|nr:glutathione S-transferase domain-containing protein [Anaeromyces robustus]|eukprot:ORX71757.1 glutathione S-transferase domain-containing protein [Anaeromyces robustus]
MTGAVGTIYSYPNNPRVAKSLIAAQYNNVKVNVKTDIEMGKFNKTPEYLAKFPFGKVPGFECKEGNIYESNAIAYYIASLKKDSGLLGKSPIEAAQVQQYVFMSDNEIIPAMAQWLYPILGFMPYNKNAVNKAQEDVRKVMTILNNILLKKTYLVGERVTLADITVFCSLLQLYQQVFDQTFRSAYTNVNRWFLTLANKKQFKNVLGEIKLCEVQAQYVPPKKEKKEKKKEAPKAKEAPKPKEAPAEEKPKEVKKKSSMDLLPKSSFNLEDWKRFYSNNDTKPNAVDYFWKNYDAEGYSMYRVDYKYNDELTQTFMSCNLIGGFFQRMELLRKYAFGTLIVTGENNNNQISGYFIIRGQKIPALLEDVPDYPSFTFTKVDSSDPKVKAEYEDYIAWEGPTFNNTTVVDGKVFK